MNIFLCFSLFIEFENIYIICNNICFLFNFNVRNDFIDRIVSINSRFKN